MADHPKTINLREDVLTAAINRWIGGLFDREHVDNTVRALLNSQADARMSGDHEAGKRRLAEAEQALTSSMNRNVSSVMNEVSPGV